MPTNPDTFKKDENRAPRKLPVNPVNGYRRGILFSAVQKLKHENGRIRLQCVQKIVPCPSNWFYLAILKISVFLAENVQKLPNFGAGPNFSNALYLSCILNDLGFAEWDKQLPRCITTKQRGSKQQQTQPSATIDSSDSGLGGLASPNSMQANEKQAVSIEIDRKRRRKNKSSKKKKVKTNKKKKTPVVVVTTPEATTTTDFSTADLFGSDAKSLDADVPEANLEDTDIQDNNLDTSA